MQTPSKKDDYVLWFVADRLERTLQYAESREAANRPDIIARIKEALSTVSHARTGANA